MGEPYEKPEVNTIDLGNLIDTAETEAAAAYESFVRAKREMEALQTYIVSLEADVTDAHLRLDSAKKALLKVEIVQELRG